MTNIRKNYLVLIVVSLVANKVFGINIQFVRRAKQIAVYLLAIETTLQLKYPSSLLPYTQIRNLG